ncbi:hypothetical protein IG7_05383 [Bacillus cereus HuA2-4]|nr:hypothetical protein IG7_05383 [Bacillus cereus HuA2-4]
MIRIAIGIKEKNKNYIPVGIYIDGSVKELTMSDLTEKECIIMESTTSLSWIHFSIYFQLRC